VYQDDKTHLRSPQVQKKDQEEEEIMQIESTTKRKREFNSSRMDFIALRQGFKDRTVPLKILWIRIAKPYARLGKGFLKK